jgi:prolyl 4-hydroxylase
MTTSPWLQRASALDAANNPSAALDELSRGTRAGDAPSARALGMRLLMGERAPLLPDAGLQFLGEACDAGLPEAAARAAGLLALGVRIPPNWPLALAWLARSAQGGWEPAQRQLLALCDDRELAARAGAQPSNADRAANPEPAASTDWAEIARAVRHADWRRSPAPTIRSDVPRVSTFDDLLRPEICDVLISFADGRLEPARVYDAARRQEIVVAHRSNTVAVFGVDSIEVVHVLLQARMSAACGMAERCMEAPTVLHYSPGEEIRDHYDFVDPNISDDYPAEIARNGQRLITFIVYLNDDYDGGETAFPKLGFEHKGRRGGGIYFVNALPDLSPDLRMVHAGRPTTRGEKWIVTQFIRDRAMR